MLQTILLFLPVLACLFWAFIYRKLIPSTDCYSLLQVLMFSLTLFLITNSSYADLDTPDEVLAWVSLFAQVSGTSIIPLLILYLKKTENPKREAIPFQYLWIVVPVILGTGGILLHFLSGSEQISEFLNKIYTQGHSAAAEYKGGILYIYYVWTVIIYRIILLVEAVWLVVYMMATSVTHGYKIDIWWKYLWKGGNIRITHLMLINVTFALILFSIKATWLRNNIMNHPYYPAIVNLILTGIICKFCYVALFSAKERISIKQMQNAFRYNFGGDVEGVIDKRMSELIGEAQEPSLQKALEQIYEKLNIKPERKEEEKESLVNKVMKEEQRWDEDSLIARFNKLMVEEKIYLKPQLTMTEVAEQLGTNKTYISRLVNNTYKLGFPELINTLRIEYAEEYIIKHKNAKQSQIAKASGFLSASSFNNTFKKVMGVTPKVWTAEHDKQRASYKN